MSEIAALSGPLPGRQRTGRATACALGGRLVLVLLCILVASAAMADEELDNDSCFGCHDSADLTDANDHSVYVDPKAFEASPHGVLSCTDCHTDVKEIPHDEKLAPVSLDTCATCHDEEVAAYRVSGHGRVRASGSNDAPTCTTCHGDIHKLLPASEASSPINWKNLARTCANCHANQDLIGKFEIPVVLPVEAYLNSVHARAVAHGEHGAVCSDCHDPHKVLPASNPDSKVWWMRVPDTCGKCHGEIAAAYKLSVHGTAAAHGIRQAPVCTDCHGEHRILAVTESASPVSTVNLPDETCGRCHGSLRLTDKYGLQTTQVVTFRDSYHGLALRAGSRSVANCASCHGTHEILPASDPRSTINPQNLPRTCGKCHPGAGSNFPIGKVHVSATTAGPSQPEYWIRLVYLWLIGLVIGFMALHNGVDFLRKARAPRAVEKLPPGVAAPERMTRRLRWQHGLVMISFPLLVYSGFALTYSKSWWSAPLVRWEAYFNFDLRGNVHRASAVVITLALLWHLVDIAMRRDVRSRMRGFLPGWKDVRFFGAMLAYYAGWRRVRPHPGACSYIEKAEYWAFLWGMAVMAATGYLLWFANWTLRYLPKWVTDVATAFHFYEAVLATLAILVWHFYWVIFDPDVYPVDMTWWSGRSPAGRILERLPEDGHDSAPEEGAESRAGKGTEKEE